MRSGKSHAGPGESPGAHMSSDLAEHISLMAAAILGPMLASYMVAGRGVTEAGLAHLRATAITQAQVLWRETVSASLESLQKTPTYDP
jgi:3-deoxy-D-arabino-heptulosonate 7-phosphate (DAHP) synthase